MAVFIGVFSFSCLTGRVQAHGPAGKKGGVNTVRWLEGGPGHSSGKYSKCGQIQVPGNCPRSNAHIAAAGSSRGTGQAAARAAPK